MSTVARPLVSLVMFDSQVPTYHGRAVYLSATATRLAGRDFDRGIGIIPGPATRGGSPVTADAVPAVVAALRPAAAAATYVFDAPEGRTLHERGRAVHVESVDGFIAGPNDGRSVPSSRPAAGT